MHSLNCLHRAKQESAICKGLECINALTTEESLSLVFFKGIIPYLYSVRLFIFKSLSHNRSQSEQIFAFSWGNRFI